MAVSPTDEQRIVDQWQRAAPALARQRRDELRRLTPEEGLVAAASVLELLEVLPPLERGSGLVEQQRIFRRQR